MRDRFYEDLLPYLLARAALPLSRLFYARLKLNGTPMTRWRLLAVLYDGRALPVTDLAKEVVVDQSTATRLIDRAAKAGLVSKKVNGIDRRSIVVAITARGREYIHDIAERSLIVDREICAELPAQTIAELKANLKTLITVLNQRQSTNQAIRSIGRRGSRNAGDQGIKQQRGRR